MEIAVYNDIIYDVYFFYLYVFLHRWKTDWKYGLGQLRTHTHTHIYNSPIHFSGTLKDWLHLKQIQLDHDIGV